MPPAVVGRNLQRALRTAMLLVAAVPAVRAQTEFSFSGYAVDFPVYQRTNSVLAGFTGVPAEQFLNITRLRLRPSLTQGENLQLALEYELSALYASQQAPPLVRTRSANGQLVDLTWTLAEGEHFTAVHFIDRLHATWWFDEGEAVLGRQRIAWGTGRVWNPTDLFNPISPTAFAKLEKDGVDALAVKYAPGNFTDVTLVVNPEAEWKQTNTALRLRSNAAEFDASVMGGFVRGRWTAGGDFAGNLSTAGVRGEALVQWGGGDGSTLTAILGADHQFTADLYALVEYQFNGAGASDPASYDIRGLAAGDVISLGRHYLAFSGTYRLHDLVTGGASVIGNLGDGSVYVGLTVDYAVLEEVSLSAGVQLFAADELDEYWYYPAVAYLKASAYF